MTMTNERENLRKALAKCLEQIHDYFGLTDAEIKAALAAAETDSDWSPHDEKKWHKTAYPDRSDGQSGDTRNG